MNEFYLKVYEIVRKIPKGRVTTYGAIAKCLGSSKSARLVGYAMNLSHQYDATIPAHRVVNRNGLLTGKHHFATPTIMQELLESEGIKVVNNQVQNFEKVFWNPCE
jgi:methylated-DNA-protein-cysteine methyltransferase-like protein